MSTQGIAPTERVAVYLLDGRILGGYVSERNDRWVRLIESFEIHEERVSGPLGAIYAKGLLKGTVEIPLTSISHWVKLSTTGLQ
ncbi:MAG: hypothetical protein JRN59_07785 [Nitrososphaerota archaeon]|nr:hypothetical protein [Nitrososphaerota archaeon]